MLTNRHKQYPSWWLATFIAVLGVGMTAILSLDLLRESFVDLEIGATSPQEVRAPQQKTYVSDVQTSLAEDQAAANVATVYQPIDRAIGRTQVDTLKQIFVFINVVRADGQLTETQKINDIQRISAIDINEEVATALVRLSDVALADTEMEAKEQVERAMLGELRESELAAERESIPDRLPFLSSSEETILKEIVPQMIVPNTFPDDVATDEKRAEASSAVEPITQQIFKDELLLDVGDEVTPEKFEILEELGLLQQDTSILGIVRNALVASLAVTLFYLYYRQYSREAYHRRRYMILLTLLILLFVFIAQLIVPQQNNVSYLYPAAALAILLGTVFDTRLGTVVTLLLAGIVGYAAGRSLEFTFYAAVGGFIALYALRDAQRLSDFFRAGSFAIIGNLIVIIIFNFDSESTLIEIGTMLGLGVANGLLSAGLAIVMFYLIGPVFQITTTLQLEDLGRVDHPLLKQLLHKAPGTYHHSMMVMTLAESAADSIGANSLLCRVGAWYHDVGKMEHPLWFSENQEGINRHDTSDPYTSAEYIVGHVLEGERLAGKYRLPERIQDFILEHHGNRLLKYFYNKALEETGEDDPEIAAELVDVSRFQYPGPRPRSRETAIVMIADSIEATSKAVQPNNEAAIEKLVRKIIDDLLAEDQLVNSGLTMGELATIRESFVDTLKGRYHVRVKYAGNDELIAANTAEKKEPETEDERVTDNGATDE